MGTGLVSLSHGNGLLSNGMVREGIGREGQCCCTSFMSWIFCYYGIGLVLSQQMCAFKTRGYWRSQIEVTLEYFQRRVCVIRYTEEPQLD